MLGIIIDSISTFMYSKLLVILLIGAGIYFTIRTKLPQMRLFKDACKAVVEKPEDENGVSSFQALMVSTASRVGTGNIIGVSKVRWHRFIREKEKMENVTEDRHITLKQHFTADH